MANTEGRAPAADSPTADDLSNDQGADDQRADDQGAGDQGTDDVWWKNAVVYQIYARLDYLADLGVDVVWVSPFYTSPMDDNGYDISDYQDVDPIFGTLADLDELIGGLHQRGMKLMIDVVVNHTSDDHPWFRESRSSTDNPKRNWYWWAPPRAGLAAGDPGAEPTNWESFFSGPTWELDPATEEYYLHLFSRRQPDLNWENADVRAAVYAMLRWWLDRGVDGFRMDVINMVSKRLPLTDGPPRAGGVLGDGSAQYITGPRIHEFLHEMNNEVIAGSEAPLITVGEMPGVTVDEAVRFTDPANAEIDMVFQFEHVNLGRGPNGKYDPQPLSLVDIKTSLNRWQTGLGARGWNSLYWNNHDQPRAVSRFGTDDEQYRVLSAKLLGTVLHMHRGTPYVYQGEELGMTNYPFIRIDDYRDIEAVNYYHAAIARGMDSAHLLAGMAPATRDNGRTPMQWDDTAQAGFSTGTPWLAVNPNYREINAAAQTKDPGSVFAHYQRLIELRHTLPVVTVGDFTLLLPAHEQIYAFARRSDRDELLVLANFSTEPVPAELDDDWSTAELLLGNYPDHAGHPASSITLRPWEAVIYRRHP